MKLMQVVPERVLVWPDSFVGPDPQSQVRARAGDVVDVDGPLEAEWLKGQMAKLAPAPDGAKPTPITNPRALQMLRDHAKAKAGGSAADAAPAPAVAKVGGALPGIDLPAKRA